MSSTRITRGITRASLALLADAITDALAAVGAQYGVTIAVAKTGGSFDVNGRFGTLKLDIGVPDASGAPVGKAAEAFRDYCWRWQLAKTDLGTSFRDHRGATHRIVGANPRSARHPILTEDASGRAMKWPAGTVRDLLELTRRREREQQAKLAAGAT